MLAPNSQPITGQLSVEAGHTKSSL